MEYLINKGFNYSGCFQYNIVLKTDNFYVMDNHGAALWAWAQHIDTAKKYNLIHIDKHFDTLATNLSIWVNSLPPDLKNVTLDEYLALKHKLGNEEFPTIRWDNYIPIFDSLYGENINSYTFFTHKYGTSCTNALDQKKVQEWQAQSLFNGIDDLIIEAEVETILNLDIDYFFLENNNKYFQLFSNQAIYELFTQISHCFLSTDKIKVLTVALSPECCGGWVNSLRIYNKLAKCLDIEPIIFPKLN
jgi:hypothetical protein